LLGHAAAELAMDSRLSVPGGGDGGLYRAF